MTEDEMNRFIASLSLATPEPEFNVRNLPSAPSYRSLQADSGLTMGGGGERDVSGDYRNVAIQPGFRAGPVSGSATVATGRDMPTPGVGYSVNTELPGGFNAGYRRMHAMEAPSRYDQHMLSLAREVLGGNVSGSMTEQDGRRGFGVGASHPLGGGGNAFINAQQHPRGGHTVMGGMDMRFARGGYAGGGDAEVQSNGLPVFYEGRINWGDSNSAADFARADQAMQAMRSAPAAPEPQAAPMPMQRRAPAPAPLNVPLPPPRPAYLDRPYEPEGPFGALDMSSMQPQDQAYGHESPYGALDLSAIQPTPQDQAYGHESPYGALDLSAVPVTPPAPTAPPAPTTDELLALLSNPTKSVASAAIDQAAPVAKFTDRAAPGISMTPQQRDLIIRTIAAESSGKTPEEGQGIAHVIMNRIMSGRYGKTPERVLFAPKQFEPWGDPRGSNYPMRHKPGTTKYEKAQAALDAAMGGDDITGGATLFWGPKSQAALGRPAPKWGRTGGLDIGETRFHRDDGGMVEEREGHGGGSRVVSTALEALRARAIPRVNPTEAADHIAFLLRNGRGNEVTNDLAGAADPNTLLQHYLSGGTGAEMPMAKAARIGRAKEMGYHTEKPYYHAGDPKTAFDNSRGELYVTTDKPFAEAYRADKDYGDIRSLLSRHQNTIEGDDVVDFFHNKVSSLDPSGVDIKYGWQAFNPDHLAAAGGDPRDAAKLLPALKREGFDSAFFPEDFPPTSSYTDPSSSRAIFYPETLRDISARFDPRLSHVSDLDYASGGTVEREGHAGGKRVVEAALEALRGGRKIFPKPQRMFPEGARPPGGEFIDAATGEAVTGQKPARAVIGVTPEGKPVFLTDQQQVDVTGSPGKGSAKTMTNLFRKSAGWEWQNAPEGYENIPMIVSTKNRGQHYYSLGADYPKGVDLARYPKETSEPRLKPTTQGNVYPGDEVGTILNKKTGDAHPVYDMVTIRNLLAGTGAAGAGAAGMPDEGAAEPIERALHLARGGYATPGFVNEQPEEEYPDGARPLTIYRGQRPDAEPGPMDASVWGPPSGPGDDRYVGPMDASVWDQPAEQKAPDVVPLARSVGVTPASIARQWKAPEDAEMPNGAPEALAKTAGYVLPGLSDFQKNLDEQIKMAGELREMGSESMSSPQAGERVLGAGMSAVGLGYPVVAPFMAGWDTLTQAAKRIGPGFEHAAEVAGMAPPKMLTSGVVNLAKSIRGGAPALSKSIDIPRSIAPEKQYATSQDGPFYRVAPAEAGSSGQVSGGIRPEVREAGAADAGRAGRDGNGVPQLPAYAEVEPSIKDLSQNFVYKVGGEQAGAPLSLVDMPPSSLPKQSAIGRTFSLAAEGSPEYKASIFDAYKRQMPEIIEQSGARNYDELMAASYKQMAKETAQQFDALPVNYSFYRGGEGNYANSKEMLADLHGNKHLRVFQGGDPHDFLHEIDPRTGLNSNEKFRAVHDAFGHGVHGNPFGAQGEEVAWATHQQMYSPLARPAMTAETRGQNSFVNYTPANAELRSRISDIDQRIKSAQQYGWRSSIPELEAERAELFKGWNYAPQKAVLLPPEFMRTDYAGGMPDYIQPMIKPAPGTAMQSPLTHFSTEPGLSSLDPARYGTGIAGDEASRLRSAPGAVRDRSYFYLGEPASVMPEAGLGPHAYVSHSPSLYNMADDPAEIVRLAREANRTSWSSNLNPGSIDQARFMNDIERMAKEYGYEGVANPKAAFPMAAVFQPKEVRPHRARGGVIDRAIDVIRNKTYGSAT